MVTICRWATFEHLRRENASAYEKYCNSFTTVSRYFGVDISAIQEHAKTCGDIQHLRAEIRLVVEKIMVFILVVIFFSKSIKKLWKKITTTYGLVHFDIMEKINWYFNFSIITYQTERNKLIENGN